MRKSKFIVLALALVLLIASVFALTAMAEDATPSLEISSKNLSYEDNIKILFAVKAENIGDADVKLNFYEKDPADNAGLTPVVLSAAYTPANSEDIGIADHYVFFTPGLAAKFVSKEIFVQATATVNGTEYKSDVARYSIVEYCHEMIAKESTDAEDDAKYMDVIEYGAAIQSFLTDDGKFNGALATDYKYVTINGGTLDGRYDSGIYLPAQTVKPTIDGATKLVTADGEIVDNAADYTVGNSNVSFAIADTKALATITFEDATSTSLPSNMTVSNTLPNVAGLTNTYAQSAAVVGTFTNNTTNTTKAFFTSNKYNESQFAAKFTESAIADVGANIVEFEADLCLDWNTNAYVEFFNLVLTDASGNAAFNIVLKNTTASNLGIYHRDNAEKLGGEIGRTLLQNADNTWFNLRVTYKYVNASTVAVEVFLNGTSIGTATKPYAAGSAISVEDIANTYIVVNGKPSHAINSYVAIDNVVFRKIAE